jgi:hypothetical protein
MLSLRLRPLLPALIRTHQTQPASIAAMTTGGDNKKNDKSSSTGCLCRGAVQLFARRKVGCGKMGSHMCIDR